MSAAIVLDSGPVGFLTNPSKKPAPLAIRQRLKDLVAAGRRVILPEVVDYEVRRELIRANRGRALSLLDSLSAQVEYLPLTTLAMRLAADTWAKARNSGLATAGPYDLDCDVILAAQAQALNTAIIVATGNPGHLSRFVSADLWSNIAP